MATTRSIAVTDVATSQVPSFPVSFLLGFTAAAVAQTAINPYDQLLYSGRGSGKSGILTNIKYMHQEGGASRFWRGNASNIVRTAPNLAATFAFKDFYRGYFASFSIQSVLGNFLAGGAAGVSTLLIKYPLDRARTELAMDTGVGKARVYTGTIDYFRKTFQTRGWFNNGLYERFGISSGGIFVYRAIQFGLYDTITEVEWMRQYAGLASKFAIAFTATKMAGLISCPFYTVCRRLVVMSNSKDKFKYKNSFDCGRQILTNEGIKAFFKGATRSVPGAVMLVTYDYLKVMQLQEETESTHSQSSTTSTSASREFELAPLTTCMRE